MTLVILVLVVVDVACHANKHVKCGLQAWTSYLLERA
jgi:hypothetical protein